LSDQRADDDDFQTVFWAAKRAMAMASEAAFGRHGVRAGQQYILLTLWEEDCLAPGEVARRLGLSTPTVTRAATRMEAAGLLARRPHQTDRRLVRLCLTSRGKSLRRVIDREMSDLTERALRSFQRSERTELIRYLSELRRNLAAG
jgi:DNA-binding MarR family transcriptional regulator